MNSVSPTQTNLMDSEFRRYMYSARKLVIPENAIYDVADQAPALKLKGTLDPAYHARLRLQIHQNHGFASQDVATCS